MDTEPLTGGRAYLYAPDMVSLPAHLRAYAVLALTDMERERRRWWHRIRLGNDWPSRACGYQVRHLLPSRGDDLNEDLRIRVYPQYRTVWIEALQRLGVADEARKLQGPTKIRRAGPDEWGAFSLREITGDWEVVDDEASPA